MDRLAHELLHEPIQGLRLAASDNGLPTLASQLETDRPTLLVLLRHFGCIFCREMLRDVRQASESVAGYPPVLVFCMADVPEAAAFMPRYWPEARVVCDPGKRFYDALELRHGSFVEMFGPRVWACGIRAGIKGNGVGVGKVIGDPWTLPGLFAIDADGQILYRHSFRHAGDHPDWREIPGRIAAAPSRAQV